MLKKVGNVFDLKAWTETFLFKQIVNKGSKHAVTAVVGLLGSAVFTTKIKPVLDQLGISIDPVQLTTGLTVLFSGAAGWIINWTIKVLDKDGDGKIG